MILFHDLRASAAESPHPTEKIAARILYPSGQSDSPRTNARPALIDALGIPQGTKIAGRSLYVHAETRAILHATRSTRGATLMVTDPFCPNCAKQIALAGISRVIVDRHGFQKLYYHKNEAAFAELSHAILAWAGVAVFVAEDGRLERQTHNAPVIKAARKMEDRAELRVSGSWWGRRRLQARGIAFEGPAFTGKYDARIEAPVAALMAAKRKALLPKTLEPVFLSHWPDTPRAFVDALELSIDRWRVEQRPAPDWAKTLEEFGVRFL